MKKLIVVHFLLFTSAMAVAQDIEKEISSCWESAVTTAEMRGCAQKASELWNKELDRYYNHLLDKLPNAQDEVFRNSQNKWIEFRDREFEMINTIYYQMKRGTMWWVEADIRRAKIIENRALELQDYYEVLMDGE